MNPHDELLKKLEERFAQLPPAVQRAIAAANVQESLRTLADGHKLHFDQWQLFENEVLLALLGFQKVEDLEQNIKAHVKVSDEMARQLAVDVNAVIFETIRKELEKDLEHPNAQTEQADEAGDVASAQPTPPTAPAAPVVQPATPPSPTPDIKVARPSEGTEYRPGQASHERKSVADDPYRESVA